MPKWYNYIMTTTSKNKAPQLSQWVSDLRTLITEVKGWALSEGWQIDSSSRVIDEVSVGPYEVEELTMYIPNQGRVHLEVIGRGDENSPGKIEMFAWPTLIRVLFFKKQEGWTIRTDSSLPLGMLDKQNFIKYAKLITGDN